MLDRVAAVDAASVRVRAVIVRSDLLERIFSLHFELGGKTATCGLPAIAYVWLRMCLWSCRRLPCSELLAVPAKVVHVDVDSAEISRNVAA